MAQASNDINFADAVAAASAIVTVTVDAFAAAEANACVNGVGQASAAASQLSRAIGAVFARAAAVAVAMVAPNVATADISVSAQGGQLVIATVDGRSEADVTGSGKGRILMSSHLTSSSLSCSLSGQLHIRFCRRRWTLEETTLFDPLQSFAFFLVQISIVHTLIDPNL